MTRRRRLTDEQLQRLAEGREAGATYRQLSAEFGLSTSAISWQCLRLAADPPKPWPLWDGVRGPIVVKRGDHFVRRYTEDEDARIREFEAEGLTDTEIARQLGRKANSIRGRLMTLARRDERQAAGATP